MPISTTKAASDNILNEVDDANLKEELRSRQNFFVDCQLERARRQVFNYAIENVNSSIVDEKLENFLNNSKFTPKINLAFAFNLEITEDIGFRKVFAHKSKTRLD